MRILGNKYPDIISIEPYSLEKGCVELRIRDKVKDVSKDGATLVQFDEFTFILKDEEGLRQKVEDNLADWIATGRSLEVNENATIICELREEIERLRGE